MTVPRIGRIAPIRNQRKNDEPLILPTTPADIPIRTQRAM